MSPTRAGSAVGMLVALALTAAACGGGSDSAETTTTIATTTTEVVETTTSDVTTTTEEVTTTTTEAPAEPVMPLNGAEILDEALAARAALVVKIDNAPRGRPQSGLNQADIVFEENVEQITRFAAVFHSEVADPVGPVRSGRTQDVELLASFNRPLFAWSGGNAGVTAAVRASDLRDVGMLVNYSGGGYYRDSGRPAPHNVYARGSMLIELAPPDAEPPPQHFSYRAPGAPVMGGEPADALRLSMDGVRVQWQWNEQERSYFRNQGNDRHMLTDGTQVNARNVVVLFVDYRPSPVDARSPEAQTVGTGIAWVFTGGSVVQGTWSRDVATDPIELTTNDGAVIELEPGRTWVELSRADRGAIVPAGVDPASIPFP